MRSFGITTVSNIADSGPERDIGWGWIGALTGAIAAVVLDVLLFEEMVWNMCGGASASQEEAAALLGDEKPTVYDEQPGGQADSKAEASRQDIN